ncbi:HAD family hydrolase [Alteromonas sp. 38]|uniref:HAD family hydrolase n=1 Tax=Alteromonas TaxID=226 RepID=UPI0012EFE9AE|nr:MULTISPECIES: HAD family hydrolase [Alteromonas]CAD5272195.1 HAD family hydrolase [Alteromonas sp. 154]VXB51229.1 HAD family hydrolase [Alteromonas sp. 38]
MTIESSLVIFDCDGVLIDSEVLSMKSWQQLLENYKVSISADYFISNFLGKSMQHVEQQIQHDFGLTVTTQIKDEFHVLLNKSFAENLMPTPGIISLLTRLNVPYCLATSSSAERTEYALSCTGLSQYFTGNIFTRSLVKHGKPAPDLFLYAAEKMGVTPKQCIVIEDSPAGIEAGIAANMQVIHYTGGSHLKDMPTNHTTTFSHWDNFIQAYPMLVSD